MIEWSDSGSKLLGSTLLVGFLDQHGIESLEYHPETIAAEIESETHRRVSDLLLDRLLTAISIVTTDLFWHDPRSFHHACHVLSGGPWEPQDPEPLEADEAAWGITEAGLLHPPENPREAFSPEIVELVTEACRRDGLTHPPKVLRIGPGVVDLGAPESLDSQFVADEIRSMLRDRIELMAGQLHDLPLSSPRGREFANLLRQHVLRQL